MSATAGLHTSYADVMVSLRSQGTRIRALVAAVALIACGQHFVVEYVTAQSWTAAPYSYTENDISDLGVPECYIGGTGDIERTICSPRHALMNLSFVLQAVLVTVALISVRRIAPRSGRRVATLLAGMFIVGIALVGLFPGSLGAALGGSLLRGILHTAGAILAIVGGNALAVYTGLAARGIAPLFAVFSVSCGATGLVGMVLLGSGIHLGLGPGGMERVAVNPIVVWFIVTGIALLVTTVRSRPVSRATAG